MAHAQWYAGVKFCGLALESRLLVVTDRPITKSNFPELLEFLNLHAMDLGKGDEEVAGLVTDNGLHLASAEAILEDSVELLSRQVPS